MEHIAVINSLLQKSDYLEAAKLLQQCSAEAIATVLKQFHEQHNFVVHSISLLTREIKPNFTYQDFHQAWLPPLDPSLLHRTATGVSASYFPFPTRVINGINTHNPNQIISIGLMGATSADLQQLQKNQAILNVEKIRHDQIEKVSTKVGETLFFMCRDDNRLG